MRILFKSFQTGVTALSLVFMITACGKAGGQPASAKIQNAQPISSDATPINQLPMYGQREKTEAMKKADVEFIASIEKLGLSREAGAKQAVSRGWQEWQRGDQKTAMMRFNQAWLLDPENGDAYHGFAILMSTRGAPADEVDRLFQMAISKKNVAVNAHVDYGRFLWTQKRLEASLTQLNASLQINPTAHNARSNIAFVHYLKGDFPNACRWAKAARQNNDQMEKGFFEDMCQRAGVAASMN